MKKYKNRRRKEKEEFREELWEMKDVYCFLEAEERHFSDLRSVLFPGNRALSEKEIKIHERQSFINEFASLNGDG